MLLVYDFPSCALIMVHGEPVAYIRLLQTVLTANYFQAVLVPTAETIRIRFFLDLLTKKKTPVMLVGGAGCGKTVLVNEKLQT